MDLFQRRQLAAEEATVEELYLVMDHRQRDLFPLPEGALVRRLLASRSARGATACASLSPSQRDWLEKGIAALNQITFEDSCMVDRPPSDSVRRAVANLRRQ